MKSKCIFDNYISRAHARSDGSVVCQQFVIDRAQAESPGAFKLLEHCQRVIAVLSSLILRQLKEICEDI